MRPTFLASWPSEFTGDASRYIVVDDLCHPDVPVIRHQVKRLRFYACRVHGSPSQILWL